MDQLTKGWEATLTNHETPFFHGKELPIVEIFVYMLFQSLHVLLHFYGMASMVC